MNPIADQLLDALAEGAPACPGVRLNHARGVVLTGRFVASPEGAERSTAFCLSGAPVDVTVRFSSASGDPDVAENSRHASPRGMAIRFSTAAEPSVAMELIGHSVDCFPARTPEDFLAFLSALRAADRAPEAFEQYLASHPAAARFVSASPGIPVSFARARYFMLHAVELVGPNGRRVAGRFEIEPRDGPEHLTDAQAARRSGRFLSDEIAARAAAGNVSMDLCFRLAEPGDALDDISTPWPAGRRKIVLGTLSLDAVITDPETLRTLSFDPARLPPGVTSAGDAMGAVRQAVYASAVARRLGCRDRAEV